MSVPLSATLTQTHLLLKEKWFAQGLRVSGKTQVGCFGNLHLYMCRIASVYIFEEEICSLHPLKMLLTAVRTQFFSMGQKYFFQVPIPLSAHLNGTLPKEVPRSVQKTRGLHLVPKQEGWEVAECRMLLEPCSKALSVCSHTRLRARSRWGFLTF